MASRFADNVFNKWLSQGLGRGSWPACLDAELAEVRAVLDELLRWQADDGKCWCEEPATANKHDDACTRARELYEVLRIKE